MRGVPLGLGEALCDWTGVVAEPDWAVLFLPEPEPSARTSATTITTMAAAAPAGISHRGRLRGPPAPVPGVYHSPGTPGPDGPPGCWAPHHPLPCGWGGPPGPVW